ncbi:MAG: hypothetical protein JRD04_07880 [Deltaproteobacteria bacterium]|nr:hypothetical protein [Deltaproteobacteria bacterium]
MSEEKLRIVKDDEHHPVYMTKHGWEAETYRVTLAEMISTTMNRFEALIEMLDDDDFGKFGFLAQNLTDHSNAILNKAYDLIVENVGVIYIDTPVRSCPIYDGGMPIGVVCKPLAEEKEVTS